MRWPIRLAFWAILFFLLTMPWLPAMLPLGINIHDVSRMVQLALFGFCALMLVLDQGQALAVFWPENRKTRWMAVATLALALFSVAKSSSPEWSFRELMVWVGWLGVVAVIAQVTYQADQTQLVRIVLGALFIQAGIMLFLVITAYVVKAPGMLEPVRFSMGYGNRRFLNHTQTVALSLGMLALFMPELTAKRNRVWIMLILALGWTLLLATMGRATLLSLGVASFALLMLYGRSAAYMLKPLTLVVLVGGAIWLMLFFILPTWLGVPPSELSIQHAEGVQGRGVLWDAAWQLFSSHPWLGAGPMQFASREVFEHVPPPDAAHPHNVYLQLMSEWGLPFTVTVAALVVRLFYRLWLTSSEEMKINSDPVKTARGLVSTFAMVAVAIDAGLSGNFVMPVPMVWVALPMGLTLGWLSVDRRGHQLPQSTSVPFASVALLVTVLQLTLWRQISPEVADIKAFVGSTHQQFPASRSHPRFWAHGWHQ